MKKMFILTLMLAFAFAMMASSALASSSIDVANSKYEPSPAVPGNYVDVWFKVENTGPDTADDMTVEFVPNYPFSLDATTDPVRSIGTLPPYEPYFIKYKVLVDNGALTGQNDIVLRHTPDPDTEIWIEEEFSINVQSDIVSVNIMDVNTVPEELSPGEKGELSFKIKNNADTTLKDISIKLDLNSMDMPFAPVGSVTEKNIDRLTDDESMDVSFDLITLADADSKIYKVPVVINYKDNTGAQYTKNDIIAILVNSKPELYLNVEESDVISSGKSGEVVLSIANTGISDANYVTMKIIDSDDYSIFGSPMTYLGNIEPDDFETAAFDIYFEKTEMDKVPVNVEIVYKDSYNKQYTKISSVDVPMYSSEDLVKFNRAPAQSGNNNLLVFAIVAILGYVAYRRFFRKKKKGSKDE